MKYLKLFESRKFITDSENKFKSIKNDISDILLELSDMGINNRFSEYIDDSIFEITISIKKVESLEAKVSTRETILRLEDFLSTLGGISRHGLSVCKIEMIQNINRSGSIESHSFDFYDTTEIEDLEKSTGILDLDVTFCRYN